MSGAAYGISDGMLSAVERGAERHLSQAAPEHGIGHAREVRHLALECLPDGADPGFCAMIALLHDCDDYKMFPDGGHGPVPNATRIMRQAVVPNDALRAAQQELSRLGYSKRLKGLAPETPEGMAASDADMLSIMGASGILRLAAYDQAVGMPFFDPEDKPNPDVTYESYTACLKESAVRHMFDKILRLPALMLTEKGRVEAHLRHCTCAAFLDALFYESGNQAWRDYLKAFLDGDMSPEGIL